MIYFLEIDCAYLLFMCLFFLMFCHQLFPSTPLALGLCQKKGKKKQTIGKTAILDLVAPVSVGMS